MTGSRASPHDDSWSSVITRREAAVFALVEQGRSLSEVADDLGIAYGTTRTHARMAAEKLEARAALGDPAAPEARAAAERLRDALAAEPSPFDD